MSATKFLEILRMMEVALYANKSEIAISGYSRQTASIAQSNGGIVVFPKLGMHGEWHEIDSVRIFYPTNPPTPFKFLPIAVPNNSKFSHPGGKDLRIRFHSGTGVTATERTQESVDAMKQILDTFNSFVVIS
jgi:hypothetical protein